MTHLPTGTVVSMQNEKSQIQNRAAALRVLQSRLLLLQEGRGGRRARRSSPATSRRAGATRCAPTCCTRTRWSRTCAPSYEVGNPSGVFDGDIDGFIEAGIRWQIGQDKAAAAAKG